MKSQICLIRHGITEGNVRHLYYGATDVALAEEGVQELKRLAGEGIYPDSEAAQYFVTGMSRTIQTLRLIYGDQPYETIEELREINFGDFEMKSYEELLAYEDYQDWINADNDSKAPPNGESIRAFNERVIRGFEILRARHSLRSLELRHKEQDALSIVICHGGTISAVLSHIWPEEYDNMYGWIPDPGHGYLLDLSEDAICGYHRF